MIYIAKNPLSGGFFVPVVRLNKGQLVPVKRSTSMVYITDQEETPQEEETTVMPEGETPAEPQTAPAQ